MDDPDAIEIFIDGEPWKAFSDFELSLGLDSYSACSFTAPFDFHRADIRELFRPTAYREMEVWIGGQQMMTGQMIGIAPNANAASSEVQLTCYSTPAQLIDNTPPESILPLEFNKVGLKQIITTLSSPFGVELSAPTDTGAPFERVKCEPDRKIQDFIVELTKQRGFVVTDRPDGKMFVTTSKRPGNPIAYLEGQPLTKVTPTFNPQQYYSQITGFATKKSGKSGSKHTVKNSKFLGSNLRTMSFMLDDAESADVPFAVQAKMGRMFGGLVSYVVEDLPTWRDPDGRLWDRNETVALTAPEAMVYRETELLVRNVVFRRSASSKTATLGLSLPGAFSGEEPGRLPWDE